MAVGVGVGSNVAVGAGVAVEVEGTIGLGMIVGVSAAEATGATGVGKTVVHAVISRVRIVTHNMRFAVKRFIFIGTPPYTFSTMSRKSTR